MLSTFVGNNGPLDLRVSDLHPYSQQLIKLDFEKSHIMHDN